MTILIKHINYSDHILFVIPEDSVEWRTFKVDPVEKEDNIYYTLERGTYDGDTKTFVLLKNDKDWNIYIKCTALIPNMQNFSAFLLKTPGETFSIMWSETINAWVLLGSGASCCTEYEEQMYMVRA